eukprot:1205715-Amorphochlora_amoeboformis.AAC.1
MSNNYRATTIGKALREALQDMLDSEDLSAEDANKFFEYFDEGMTKKLIELKPNPKKKKVQLKVNTSLLCSALLCSALCPLFLLCPASLLCPFLA